MSLNVNTNNYNNPIPTTSVKQTSGSSSPVGNVPVGEIDELTRKICDKLGITKEEFDKIKYYSSNFAVLSEEQQRKIVDEFRKNQTLSPEVAPQEPKPQENPAVASKIKYNNLTTVEDKFQAVLNAFAKNIYINGITDKKGNVISQPHSLEEWNNLSEEEQNKFSANFKTNLQSLINNNEDLKYLTGLLSNNMPEENQEQLLDALMRNLQAAEFSGKSFKDFMKMSDNDRFDAIYDYMKANPEALNKNDRAYQAYWNNLTNIVKTDVLHLDANNIDGEVYPSDVSDIIKYNNLSTDELLYKALKNKIDNNVALSDSEKKQFETLDKLLSTPEGKVQIDKAKAANLKKLEAEYAALKAKGDKKDAIKLVDLERTINSEESARLRRDVKVPEPATDFEKKVVSDIEEITAKLPPNSSSMEVTSLVAQMELKMKGMTPEQKCDYIKTFIKFYNGSAAVNLFKHYSKAHTELYGDENIVDVAAFTEGERSAEQDALYDETSLRAFNSDNPENRERGRIARLTTNSILASERYSGAEYDNRRVVNAGVNSQFNDVEILNSTTRVNSTIKDADKAIEAQNLITNSEFVTDEVHINTVKEAKNFVAGAQARVMNSATDKSAEATVYAAENNLIEGLAKEAQTEAFSGTHNAINKHFEDEDAIKYSNSLADQIQYCDLNNQLAMHKNMMGSKYSAVQEHAAGNIDKYDPTVRADALEVVYASGNTKAISNAIESLCSSNSPVQSEVLKQADLEKTLTGALNDDDKAVSDLAERIRNGKSLTPEEYKMACFKALSSSKQIEILSNITDINMKKAIYRHIASSNKSFLKKLIENNAKTAEFIYGMKIVDSDMIEQIAEFKAPSDNGFRNLLEKIRSEHYKKFGYDYNDDKPNKNTFTMLT